ncbi:MAG: FlgD immunoglobulin-like domain containing protein [bacterium]
MRVKYLTATVILSVIMSVFSATSACADSPDTLWTRLIGTSNTDYGYSVKQTPDGGFIMTGLTHILGNADVYLLKTDANGDSLWSRIFGGPEEDVGNSVCVCEDGGYVIAGYTYSYGAGSCDLYLIRTDADGDTLWTKLYGAGGADRGNCVITTDEGGFLVAGSTNSWWYRSEAWMLKTDADGDTVWTVRLGEVNNTYAHDAVETTLGGQTYSVGGVCRGLYTSNNFYLIRLSEIGDTLWTGAYGSGGWEDCFGIDRTDDYGFLLAGTTNSITALNWDFYVIRADAGGDTLWHRVLGGSHYECAYSIKETSDGGCIVVGETESYGHGKPDAYVIKLDANGDSLWTRAYGSSSTDKAYEVQITSDGGYIVGGYGYDFSGGGYDFYLIRLGAEASVDPEGQLPAMRSLKVSPNPFASSVAVSYSLSAPTVVRADIFDIRGRQVRSLLRDVTQEAGLQSLMWDGRNSEGVRLPAGIYFCRLRAGGSAEVAKTVLID